MLYQAKNHEEEVQLRLQFESKLNSLHSLHRDVKAQYSRALEDILNLQEQLKEKTSLCAEQSEELIKLRSEKVENLSKISLQSEKLENLTSDLTIKNRQN